MIPNEMTYKWVDQTAEKGSPFPWSYWNNLRFFVGIRVRRRRIETRANQFLQAEEWLKLLQ